MRFDPNSKAQKLVSFLQQRDKGLVGEQHFALDFSPFSFPYVLSFPRVIDYKVTLIQITIARWTPPFQLEISFFLQTQ